MKYDLMKYIKLRHEITAARWEETEKLWTVTVEDSTSGQRFEDHCDILINAGGYLNKWKWPNIPGIKDYKGKLLHSANWTAGVELKGKKVGLIGNG